MNGDISDLDLFSFAETSCSKEQAAEKSPASELSLREMQQMTLGFLASLRPDAAARQVPARFQRMTVTAAGFWRTRGGRKRRVERTAIVVLCPDFNGCFSECYCRSERLEKVSRMQAELEEIEAEIRQKEPHLAAADDLFDDFRTWDYSSSSDQRYLPLRNELDREITILTTGGRLDRLVKAAVADYCYLAAPEKVAAAAGILPGWGLVELSRGKGFTLLREAERQLNVTPEGRQLLALNIAQAAAASVCFAAGVEINRGGQALYRNPPRKRGRIKL